jgi:hypothetical protein
MSAGSSVSAAGGNALFIACLVSEWYNMQCSARKGVDLI